MSQNILPQDTSPFKTVAAEAADILSDEVRRIGAANILRKTASGIEAYNSDYRGLLTLIPQGYSTAAVIGTGGAGRAALAAAQDLGMCVRAYHHDELEDGLNADIVIYTPSPQKPKARKRSNAASLSRLTTSTPA